MSVFFRRRGEPPATTIAVTITGSGNVNNCYAIINGTKQYEAGTHEVKAGDTITFGVFGQSSKAYGFVKIDGTQVLKVMNGSVQTYDWTVPRRIAPPVISVSVKTSAAAIAVTTA